MKTPIVTTPNTLLTVLFVALMFTFAGCNKSAKTEGTASNGSVPSLAIPALFERSGDLAKADEWPKTKEKIEELKKRLSKDPNDIKARLQIVTIYLAEARITGEHPYYYPAILQILDGTLHLNPNSFEAITYKASVKMSQHQFAEARDLAEKARKLNESNAYIYGVLVDANVELGMYKEAIAMSDKMQALKPSLEAYSRSSYLREIHGDYKGAIVAMQMAAEAGLPGSEPYCWSKTTLGHLYETTGKLKEAEKQYAEILAIRPSYAFAYRGQARILKINKKYDEALMVLEKAAKIMPEFSFHEEMAEIYVLQNKLEKAKTKYAEVAEMLDEDAKSGHSVDLELCKLYTKAGQLDRAAVYGMKEYKKRPNNIDVNHAMAVLAMNMNDFKKAKDYITVAMSTGSKEPELLNDANKINKTAAASVASL